MVFKGDIRVINKVIKKVVLDLDYTIMYAIEYDVKSGVYVYSEYVEVDGIVSLNNSYAINSINEVKNTLKDLCGHYGSLDYVLYNNDIEGRDVVIDLTTDNM